MPELPNFKIERQRGIPGQPPVAATQAKPCVQGLKTTLEAAPWWEVKWIVREEG
jgi:hypothetical protein